MQFPSLVIVGQLPTFQLQREPTILTANWAEVQALILNLTSNVSGVGSGSISSEQPCGNSEAPILGFFEDSL